LLALGCARAKAETRELGRELAPAPKLAEPPKPSIAALTEALRAKGFDECNPYCPLGLGPYAPFQRVALGKIMIPQKGGHTADMGYDVVIHFHGGDAARKYLVQAARGVVLVTVDKGVGGGPYARALGSADVYPLLLKSIEKALQRHSGKENAHIRHLALSAWSAGTTAIGKILSQGHGGFDAVIVLDGLHGVYKLGARRGPGPDALDARAIEREIELARRAQRGELTFVLTHSRVDPYVYPSTGSTAELLVRELGLKAKSLAPRGDPFGQTSALDAGKLHVWGFSGNEKLAHCSQLAQLPRVVTELLEPAWGTPAMDRSVPPTPLHIWQRRAKR
jgi:hypothetical protein